MALGLRYEKTDVTLEPRWWPTAIGINWVREQRVLAGVLRPDFTTLEGSYDYVLPDIDFAFDLTDTMKLRASAGETIGRPGWGNIQGGQTLNQLVRIDGGTGQQGNPGTEKPSRRFERTFDLSSRVVTTRMSSYLSVRVVQEDTIVTTSAITTETA
jgi:hypothetical protein